mgnify:FL=1
MSTNNCIGAIPDHLKKFDWYARHQAWLRDNGFSHHDPDGATAKIANLYGTALRNADLIGANLTRAILYATFLRNADLCDANLYGTALRNADLIGANLRGANLTGADLRGACLRGADIQDAIGIVSFGPCPGSGRIGYVVASDTGPMVILGCFWGTVDKAKEAIYKKYDGETADAYIAIIDAAVRVLKVRGGSQ